MVEEDIADGNITIILQFQPTRFLRIHKQHDREIFNLQCINRARTKSCLFFL